MKCSKNIWELSEEDKAKAIAYFKAQAADANRRRYESEENSDTDGFLTQWALSHQCIEYQAMAEWVANNGISSFIFLMDQDEGRLLDAKIVDTAYGLKWVLSGLEEARYGRKWIPIDDSEMDEAEAEFHAKRLGKKPRRSKVQVELGLGQVTRDCYSHWDQAPFRVGDPLPLGD